MGSRVKCLQCPMTWESYNRGLVVFHYLDGSEHSHKVNLAFVSDEDVRLMVKDIESITLDDGID